MSKEFIRVGGTQEYHLKKLTLEIPRDNLVVITGLSGTESRRHHHRDFSITCGCSAPMSAGRVRRGSRVKPHSGQAWRIGKVMVLPRFAATATNHFYFCS